MYANVNEHLEAIKKIYSSIEDVKKSTVPVGENFIILDADGTGNDYYVGFLSYTNDGTGIDLQNGLFLNRRIQTSNVIVYSKTMVEDTIDSLKSSGKYRIGDVVEVLGYYAKGDGSNHKRVASNIDDGTGVLGQNNLWWNIVENGFINVSWLGAKGDGITDDSLYCRNFKKNKTYIFDKTFHLFSSIDIPVGTSISGNFVNMRPTNGNSIFKLSRLNIINLSNIFLLDGYNGYCFELNSNEKARIEAKFGESVNVPRVCIKISNINVTSFSDNVNGYFLKLYCDGNNFGMYGMNVDSISGSSKIDGFLESDLLKLSSNRTSWLTGMNFSNITLGDIKTKMFYLKNVGADFKYEGWSFKNVQLQAYGGNRRIFDFDKCKEFKFENIIAWDWGSAGGNKPFVFKECDNFYFADNMVGGFTYIEDIECKLNTFHIEDGTRNFNEFISHSNPVTYNELLKLPEGSYYIYNPVTFVNLGCPGGNRGTLKIEYDYSRMVAIWKVFYKTNGIQYEEGLSETTAVIWLADTETNFTLPIETKVWKKTPKQSELYKGQMMSYGTFANRPDVDSVPDGFVYMNTNPATLFYKINGVWNTVNIDKVN